VLPLGLGGERVLRRVELFNVLQGEGGVWQRRDVEGEGLYTGTPQRTVLLELFSEDESGAKRNENFQADSTVNGLTI